MGNLLDAPTTEKHSENLITKVEGIHVGVTGLQGWRSEMEDEHIAVDIPSLPSHVFLAVYDGHGGDGAAKYAGGNMVAVLERTKQWLEYRDKFKSEGSEDMSLLGDALIQTFLNIDVDIKYQQGMNRRDRSGCTSVVAIITPSKIICANAGDSRCIIGTNGRVKFLSEDHKPTDFKERNRIERAGGAVIHDRVDGDLAVSRALGDFQWKKRTDLPPEQQRVSCYPDIMIHERCPNDEVLLLACDGLWDVYSNEEAVTLVHELFASGETSVVLIAEELVDCALNKGSKDNISAIVAIFPGAKFGPSSNGGVMRRREERYNSQYGKYEQYLSDENNDVIDEKYWEEN